jgi:hypothetical protein
MANYHFNFISFNIFLKDAQAIDRNGNTWGRDTLTQGRFPEDTFYLRNTVQVLDDYIEKEDTFEVEVSENGNLTNQLYEGNIYFKVTSFDCYLFKVVKIPLKEKIVKK